MAEHTAGAASGGVRAAPSGPPGTLTQAHEALVRIRPKSGASPATWKCYYERSAVLYREIAEIDRGHHHEALYWAEREQEKATEFAARISAGEPPDSPYPTRWGGADDGTGPRLGTAGRAPPGAQATTAQGVPVNSNPAGAADVADLPPVWQRLLPPRRW